MGEMNLPSSTPLLRRTFDGIDYIYEFDGKVIVYHENVDVIENLYAENVPLFTASYLPKPGDVVVDVGAGNGYELQEFSRMVGPSGRVIAIEADSNCFRRLSKIVKIADLQNVTCINSAVSDSEQKLFLVDNHPAGISNFLQEVHDPHSVEVVTKPTRTILEAVGITHIDFLKMNIEGHEYKALVGLGPLLKECSHLVIACHDFLELPSMRTRNSVIRLLEQNGFTWAALEQPDHEWEKDYLFAINKSIVDQLAVTVNGRYRLQHYYRNLLALKDSGLAAEKHMKESVQAELSYLQNRTFYLIAKGLNNLARKSFAALKIYLNYVRSRYLSVKNLMSRIATGRYYRFNRVNETFFVGTTRNSGKAQLSILREAGLRSHHKLVEFGCGALNGSRPIFEFLARGNYVGVDPNSWLRTLRTLKSFGTFRSRILRRPQFFSNSTFDVPSRLAESFDFVFAHSVLSHASLQQVHRFFASSSSLLVKHGFVVASWRDTEGNAFGSSGAPNGKDSEDAMWVYPGVTYFSKETLRDIARRNGFEIEFRSDLTKMLVSVRPGEFHDWFVARKNLDF